MSEKKIKYLMKIQSNAKFQESLVNKGELYSNCAKYYRKRYETNNKQGDFLEHSLRGSSAGVNLLNAMFCMSYIEYKDVIDNKIILPRESFEGFVNGNIYITIFDYEKFKEKVLNYCKNSNISVWSGIVVYGNPSKQFLQENYNIENIYKFMFIKSKEYEEQKEYRFVFDKKCEIEYKQELIDGMIMNVENGIKECRLYIGDLKDISQSFSFKLNDNDKEIILTVNS